MINAICYDCPQYPDYTVAVLEDCLEPERQQGEENERASL